MWVVYSEDTSNKCVQSISDELNLFWSAYLLLCVDQLYLKSSEIPIVKKTWGQTGMLFPAVYGKT